MWHSGGVRSQRRGIPEVLLLPFGPTARRKPARKLAEEVALHNYIGGLAHALRHAPRRVHPRLAAWQSDVDGTRPRVYPRSALKDGASRVNHGCADEARP